MAISRLTSQGRISIPADVRRKLGLVPGSLVEWVEENGRVVVRPAGRFTSEDIHKAVFPEWAPKKVSVIQMKAGIRKLVRKRRTGIDRAR